MPSRLALLSPPALWLGAVLVLGACATDAPEPAPVVQATREAAPAVVLPTAEGPVDLTSLAGHPIVLQFAQADDAEAWTALADALADLEAAGASVVAVRVDGAQSQAARAFGYTGVPLAVVVDGEGTVRGRGAPRSGDDLFALASPVLAEADVAATVAWAAPETLDALVAAGGVVVDVSEPGDPAAFPGPALRLAPDTMAAIDLPADLGTPLAFVGPEAKDASGRAARWGYAAVFVADAAGAIAPVDPPRPIPARDRPLRSGGVRG